MIKLSLPLCLLSLLLTNGCKQVQPAGASEANATASAKEAELQHKIACKQFEDAEQKQAGDNVTGLQIVDSVFYSPKENSCLVAKHTLWYPKYAGGRDPEDLEINDLLGGKQLYYCHFDHAQDAATVTVLMERKIKQFQELN